VPKYTSGSVPMEVWAPSDPPNDGLIAICSPTKDALIRSSPRPPLRRNLEAQQVEIARLLQQLPRQLPVVFVEPFDDRQHFLLHEFRGGLSEQPLLLGEIFSNVDVVRIDGGREKLSAGDWCLGLRHGFV
jgi:hypothetical protein